MAHEVDYHDIPVIYEILAWLRPQLIAIKTQL